MKKINSFLNWSINQLQFKLLMLAIIFVLPFVRISAQSTVFTDNFNGKSSTTFSAGNLGGTPQATYNIGTGSNGTITYRAWTAPDYCIQIAPNSSAGTSFVYFDNSVFFNPYNALAGLKATNGLITWYFNLRHYGSSSSYKPAVVIAASSSDFNTASGYAVYYGKTTNYKLSLARFVNGVSTGTITDIIPETASGAITVAGGSTTQDYVSIMVTYNPSTDSWSLYARDDASTLTTAWSGSALTQQGSATTDGTGTLTSSSNNLKYSGLYYKHSNGTSSTYKITFDNFRVDVTATSAPTNQASALTFTTIATTSLTANWTNGNGYKRIVKINTTNSFTDPTDGTTYTANAFYGGSGEQVVYDGTGNSVNVTGLTANTPYWFRVYEYYYGASLYSYYNKTDNALNTSTIAAAVVPSVTSPTVTSITNTAGTNSATLGANVTSDGGSAITERGTVWKTSAGVTISDNKLAEGATTTGSFTHSRSSFASKTKIYFAGYAINNVGNTLSSESSFFTLGDEPTSAVGDPFASNSIDGSYTSLNLTWLTATGADGYLILQRTGASAPGTAPTDATNYSVGNVVGTGTIAAIVTSGSTTSQVISGLLSNTQYTFRIYPFAYDGTNYQTFNFVGNTLSTSVTATTPIPPTSVYTWQGADNADFTVAANWSPTRSTPYTNDIIQFNDGTTKTVTNVPTQTIAQLSITNNTAITLQSSASVTITISGDSGTDFVVSSGSSLTIAQATNAITIALATGATGTIAGSINYNTAAHKITAVDLSSINFQNGAVFSAGSAFSGNAFGTTNNSSIVFASGSTYIQGAGGNPFGATQPGSAVVFQSGSLFKCTGSVGPSYSGRTYANFEVDETGTTQNNQGSAGVTFDNFTVTNGTVNWDFTGGVTIKGNINVTSNGILSFGNASNNTVVTLSGASAQTITVNGTLTNGTNSSYTISNTVGVNLTANVTVPTLTITGGILNVNAGKQLTVSTTLVNNGILNLLSTSENGTATILTPATITESGTTTVQQYLTGGRNWYVSSPVSGETCGDVFSVAGLSNKLYWYDEAHGTNNPWPAITDNATSLTPMQGYIANMAADGAVTFSGKLNTSESIKLQRTALQTKEGFNLVGNPYPAHIAITKAITDAASALNTIWYRTSTGYDSQNSKFIYAFRTCLLNDDGSFLSTPLGTCTNIIAPMQAIWVRTNTNGSTLDFTNIVRSHQSSNALKAPASKNDSQQILRLLVTNSNAISDETVLYFNSNASNSFDMYDAQKMFNNSVSVADIYTVASGEQLAINGLNAITFDTEMPIGFSTVVAGNFSFKASQINNFEARTQIILKDYLNPESPVTADLSDGSSYPFASEATTNNTSRFALIFRAPSVTTGINAKSNDAVWISTNGNGQIMINGAAKGETSVAVYNTIGQKVASQKLTSTTKVLDNQLAAGVYTVTVNNAGRSTAHKVIVN